jgi:cytidine deaminase
MDGKDERHYAELQRILARAYAPYSGFRVAARLEAAGGELVDGCNVENASFGLCLCAERVALARALAQGLRCFSRVYLLSSGEGPVSPCGACREALHRYAPDLEIVMFPGSPGGEPVRCSLAEILPR